MTDPIWIVLRFCIAALAGPICGDRVFPFPAPTPLACMVTAGDISRAYEGADFARCMSGPKPLLPDILLVDPDRYG